MGELGTPGRGAPGALARLIFPLVFSTLQSSLTVLPNRVNTAPAHTSITSFLPRVDGGSSLGTVRQFSFPLPSSWVSADRLRRKRGSWDPPTPPPLVLTEVCVAPPQPLLLEGNRSPRLVLDLLPPSARGGRGQQATGLGPQAQGGYRRRL